MVNFKIRATGFTQFSSITGQLSAFANSQDVSRSVITKAVAYSKTRVDKDTGALRDAIFGRYGRVNAGISIRTPNNRDGRKRPYQLWRHGIGIYGNRIRTNRAILFRTVPYMRRLAREEYSRKLQTIR